MISFFLTVALSHRMVRIAFPTRNTFEVVGVFGFASGPAGASPPSAFPPPDFSAFPA